MPLYVQLVNYTEKGMMHVKESPNRLDAAKAMLQDMGGRMIAFYLTMGNYDAVAVFEAPDDDTAALFAMRIGQLGNVRTTTLRAFDEGEFRKICQKLP